MKYLFILALSITLISCGTKNKNEPENTEQTNNSANVEQKYEIESKGIGPVDKVELGSMNQTMINEGEQIFNSKCIACHTLDEKRLGPPLRDVTKRLRPEFIMNYLLNTQEMQQKDEHLKTLVKQYNLIMPDQNLKQSEARSVLEYLRFSANNQ